jgi:hypothetical protein
MVVVVEDSTNHDIVMSLLKKGLCLFSHAAAKPDLTFACEHRIATLNFTMSQGCG